MIIAMLWKSKRTGTVTRFIADVPYIKQLQSLEEKAKIIGSFMERDHGFGDYKYISATGSVGSDGAIAMPASELKRYLKNFGSNSQQYLKEFNR